MDKYFPDYSIQISTPDMFIPPEDMLCSTDHTWHGAAIAWHTSLDSCISHLKTTNNRFTCIRVALQEQVFLALSVYFPTSGKDDLYLGCTNDLRDFISDNLRENEMILLGCDSNCSEKSSSRRRLAFQNLCQDLDLVRMSPCHPTFHHHNGMSESNIDTFLISKKLSPRMLNLLAHCTLDTPDNLSSHDPVSASLRLSACQTLNDNTDYSHTYTDFTRKKIIWNPDKLSKYQELAATALIKYEAMFPLLDHIPLKCELYSRLLVRAAEMSLDTKPASISSRKVRKPSLHVHQAWQKLRKAFREWKISGKLKDTDEFLTFKKARALFQSLYRREVNLQYIKKNNTIMMASYSNSRSFFNIIKNMRSKKKNQPPYTLNTPGGTYLGRNTLEGFTVDAEILGQAVSDTTEFDNEFYKLCVLDNLFVFEFKGDDAISIPEMSFEVLESILNKDMKLGKACDVYQLTVEHLRHAGVTVKRVLLRLINSILKNIFYLTCPQAKKGISSCVFKGKQKPVTESSSYRRITVTPQLGSIIDRYIDPIGEGIFLKVQSSDQYGFTKGVSYLMAAILRGECQRYALDNKQTCYGVSFDGKAAFPSVDRNIQVRELYSCGERGDVLHYSRNTYHNTVSHIKQSGKLGREFREHKGARQGHKRASGHFKSYINPCLAAANDSELGFWIGPICVTCICVADDTYVLSGDPRQLQGIVNIVEHYSKRYRVTFGADKTKVTITGSKQDMLYYQDINMWTLGGARLPVTEDNEHLGLIVSGQDEEIKNVDRNIQSARAVLFSLLGNIFSYRCQVSQTVLLHVWTIYVSPVLRSGLSTLPIRPTVMKTITAFHQKILRGILKLSSSSPLPAMYFLLGELPIEAALHRDIFSIFWNIWANPQTKIHDIVKYLLFMADSSSLTWTAHLRLLFQMYNLPDPLGLLNSQLMPKQSYKTLINTAIIAFHEKKWRVKAKNNSKLVFLNVQVSGLAGRPHPALSGILTTRDVQRSRVHIKMLSGDYPCYSHLGYDQNQPTHCRLCLAVHPNKPPPEENMVHLLAMCRGTSDIRSPFISNLLNTVSLYFPENELLVHTNHTHLTQFILDPTSLNLPTTIRVAPGHPAMAHILDISRSLCYATHKARTNLLKKL